MTCSKDAAGLRTVQDLSQREFRLQDRDVVTIAGLAVGSGVRVRQLRQPFTQQRIDLRCGQAVAHFLQAFRVCAREDAVVERLKGDAHFGELPFDVLMAVEAQLGVVREVGAELQKERTEVFIDAIEVELVHRHRTLDDPRILLAVGGRAFLRAKDVGLLLRFAQKQDAFAPLKACPMFGGDIVLALALAKLHDRNAVLFDEGVDLFQERVGHDAHQRRGGNGLLAMELEEAGSLLFRLQFRLIDVEVHAIDTFNFQGYVILDDVRNTARYTHI